MLKEKVILTKEIAQALQYTLSIPEYQNNIEEIMNIQKSPTKYWIDGSHLLNELSVDDLYRALTEGYTVI